VLPGVKGYLTSISGRGPRDAWILTGEEYPDARMKMYIKKGIVIHHDGQRVIKKMGPDCFGAMFHEIQIEVFEPADLHPPPGDRVLRGITPTALLFFDDGTLLVGSADGTVTAIRGGQRRHSLGFRGAIRGLVPAGDGLVAVTTALGVVASITGEGKVHWERQVTAEPLGRAVVAPNKAILAASERGVFALSPSGDLLVTHASPRLYRYTCNQWGYQCSECSMGRSRRCSPAAPARSGRS
jgi:hypothetical protein